MKAVAELSGVSVMTVSRTLRNDGRVAPETRRRVLLAAERLGYRPNPMVSALMANLRFGSPRKTMDTIAYLVSHSADPRSNGRRWRTNSTMEYFRDGARERAERLGFRLEEFWLVAPGMTQERMGAIMRARGIGGIVVAPLENPGGSISLDWNGFAVATIGYSLLAPILHRASNHQLHSIRLAINELTARGYRRIGLAIERKNDVRADHNWVTGLLYYQNQIPPKDRIPPFLPAEMSSQGVADWIRKWKPDVIMSGRLGLLRLLKEMGLRVPDDIGYASLAYYPEMGDVAGVDQNTKAVGGVAVDLVVDQLYRNERGIPERSKIVMIEGDWVDGGTVRGRGD